MPMTGKRKKPRKPTMVDVAAKAGVTIGTVSHVINKTAPISGETTERVLEAIRELGYKPNSIARALRTQKSNVIGLLLPDVTNDFYAPVLSSFIDSAYTDGYTVLVVSYQYSGEREAVEMERLADKNVDGILLFNGFDDLELLRRMKAEGMPVVVADRRVEGIDLPTVEFDNIATASEVVGLMCRKGYRKIGFLSESIRLKNLKDRYEGYIKGLTGNGLPVRQEFIYISEDMEMNNLEKGYSHMKQVLESTGPENLPDAIFATTDLLGIGAARAFREAGFRIPEEIGIVGFDNISFTDFVEPKLTTVDQDKVLMGRIAWEIMKEALDGEGNEVRHAVLPQRIILKGSC